MRRFRGALVPAVLVLISLLILGLGVGLYLQHQQGRRTPSPWPEGKPVAALATSDPTVASVARTRQYVEAWQLTDPGDPWLTPLYTVDPGTRADPPQNAPAGLRAGFRTTVNETSAVWPAAGRGLFDRTTHPLQVIEWAAPDRLGTFWQGYAANPVLARETLPGADEVLWYAGTNAQGCRVPDPVFLSVVARIGQTTLEASFGCLPRADADSAREKLRPLLQQTITAMARVTGTPLPATYPSLADRVPLIAGRDWAPEQIQVAGRTDGVDATALIAPEFRDRDLQAQLRGRNTVLAYADATAVDRILTVDPTASYQFPPRETRINAHRAVCQRVSVEDKKERCLIGVGRFLVVASADAGDSADQVKALEGVG